MSRVQSTGDLPSQSAVRHPPTSSMANSAGSEKLLVTSMAGDRGQLQHRFASDGHNRGHQPSASRAVLVDLTQTKWFFVLFAGLFCLALLNLTLTIWIIKAFQLGKDGLGSGSLHLIKKGINVRGEATFAQQLRAELIQATSTGHPLNINSPLGAGLTLRGSTSPGEALDAPEISVGDHKVEMQTSRFLVKAMDRNLDTGSSGAQRVLFEATPLETTTSTSTITAPSVGGYRITDRIETSLVEGELNQDLRLEARTERVTIDGGDDVIVSSKAGSVKANAYHEFRMMGNERIVLDARRLEMRGLKRATVSPGEDSTATSAFQASDHNSLPPEYMIEKKGEIRAKLEKAGLMNFLTNAMSDLVLKGDLDSAGKLLQANFRKLKSLKDSEASDSSNSNEDIPTPRASLNSLEDFEVPRAQVIKDGNASKTKLNEQRRISEEGAKGSASNSLPNSRRTRQTITK